MSGFVKFSSQVPELVLERFRYFTHGHMQLVCTGALVWYLNADKRTQRLYRDWARGIAEGYATIETPPEGVTDLLPLKPRTRPKTAGKRGKRASTT